MTDYGRDVSTFPDLDVTGREIEGVRAVAECTLRRFMSEEGATSYDRTFGRDIRDLLNEDMTERDARREEQRLATQAELDERILRASVSLTLEPSAHKLKIRVTGELADGTEFRFVLAVTDVSAVVLEAS